MTTELPLGCDQWPLHYAVRIGNLSHVKYLVNVLQFDVNESDYFDNTPLYLAALIGREDICQFLLENGAKCDPSGDAARVFYVALTPKLRRLLRQWSLTAASRDAFVELLRKQVFNVPEYSDLTVTTHGETFYLHRVIIWLRCKALYDRIVNGELVLSSECRRNAVAKLLEYLYTGKLETRDIDEATQLAQFGIEMELTELYEQLHSTIQRHEENPQAQFSCQVSDDIRVDLRRLALWSSTREECAKISSDITLKWSDIEWPVHAIFICSQSDYFHCAMTSGFRESHEASIDLTHLVPSSRVVELALQWFYCDSFLTSPTIDEAVQLLEFGSAVLCPRLGQHTANTVLMPAVNAENVFEMLSLARIHGLDRFEDKCVEVLAFNLETLADSPMLQHVLKEEISQTEQKGDVRVTDVPIAAEIRSNIRKAFDDETRNGCRDEKICMLDLLESALGRALAVVSNERDEEKKMSD